MESPDEIKKVRVSLLQRSGDFSIELITDLCFPHLILCLYNDSRRFLSVLCPVCIYDPREHLWQVTPFSRSLSSRRFISGKATCQTSRYDLKRQTEYIGYLSRVFILWNLGHFICDLLLNSFCPFTLFVLNSEVPLPPYLLFRSLPLCVCVSLCVWYRKSQRSSVRLPIPPLFPWKMLHPSQKQKALPSTTLLYTILENPGAYLLHLPFSFLPSQPGFLLSSSSSSPLHPPVAVWIRCRSQSLKLIYHWRETEVPRILQKLFTLSWHGLTNRGQQRRIKSTWPKRNQQHHSLLSHRHRRLEASSHTYI